MPAPTDSTIFGGWPPTPEDQPPKTEPHGDNNPPGDYSAAIPFWLDNPQIYDTCQLGGMTLPGLAQLTANIGRKLDVKQAKGVDGATITDNGSEVEDVQIVLTMWTRPQWSAYQQILPAIDPNNQKGKTTPKDIVHPMVNLHGIRRVYVTKISSPQPSRLKGAFEITIQCKGWRPEPKNPVSKTNTAKKADNKTDPTEEFGHAVVHTEDGDVNVANKFLSQEELSQLAPSTDPPK
jgi:hypothetical protein